MDVSRNKQLLRRPGVSRRPSLGPSSHLLLPSDGEDDKRVIGMRRMLTGG